MSAEQSPVGNLTLRHALALAGKGFKVFPCRQGSKLPATSNGVKDATDDERTIRAWFAIERGYNLAIACGPQPNGIHLYAIDVDPKHGGDETWSALCEGRPLPVAPRHETPSGGHHLFFNAPADLPPTVGRLGAGIDTRGEGSYVVGPPSKLVERDTGEIIGHYTSSKTSSLIEVPVPLLPAWVVRGLTLSVDESVMRHPSLGLSQDGPFDRVRDRWDWFVELPRDGWTLTQRLANGDTRWTRPGKDPREGSSATLHAGGAFVVFTKTRPEGGGATRDGEHRTYSPGEYVLAYRLGGDMQALMAAYPAAVAARSGEPRRDLDAGVRASTPAPDGDATPYLQDEFWQATVLLSAVREAALSKQRTPDSVLAALLTMYATTIPMNIVLPEIVGAPAPLNLYAVVAAVSGGGKTTAMTIAHDLMGRFAHPDVKLRQSLRSGEGLVTKVLKPRTTKGDESVERAYNVGVHVHYDEGGTLSKQQYQQAATIVPFLNTAWSGQGMVGGAKADGDYGFDAARVRITALIGVQFGVGANLFVGEAATMGFPQRLLFLMADGHPAIQDQVMPDEPEPTVPLDLPFLAHHEYVKPYRLTIPRPIRQEVWDWSKQSHDRLDSHLMNLRLRVASILMLMHGAGEGDFETFWSLSGSIIQTHQAVRHTFVDALARDRVQGRTDGEIADFEAKQAAHSYYLDKGVVSLLTKLTSSGGSLTTRQIKDHFRSWKRHHVSYTEIIERAVMLGKVERNGPNVRKL